MPVFTGILTKSNNTDKKDVVYTKKMKPVDEYWKHHEGCRLPNGRGTKWIAWSFDEKSYGAKHGPFTIYASGCVHCNQYWGWTIDIRKAMKLVKAMKYRGCPKCKKRLSEKKYKKLQKIIKKNVDS